MMPGIRSAWIFSCSTENLLHPDSFIPGLILKASVPLSIPENRTITDKPANQSAQHVLLFQFGGSEQADHSSVGDGLAESSLRMRFVESECTGQLGPSSSAVTTMSSGFEVHGTTLQMKDFVTNSIFKFGITTPKAGQPKTGTAT